MKRSLDVLRLPFLLLLVVMLAACAAQPAAPSAAPAPTTDPVSATVAPVATAVPATVAPTGEPKAKAQELIVFAAASLTESFKELGQQFEAAHPGAKVVFNFAGSQQLRAQLEQGAPADVFASANKKEMDAAIKASLVVSGTQQTFARNRLIVIYPKDSPGSVETLADLAKPGLKLVIADKAVPVGQYTLDMLAKMSKDPTYGADFAGKVQKNVVSLEQDVKAVVAKVQLGEADAGVVYSTDASAAGDAVTALQIPDQFNQLATYPIAALEKAPQPELAQQFMDLVLSDQGQQVMQKYGFLPPKAAAGASS